MTDMRERLARAIWAEIDRLDKLPFSKQPDTSGIEGQMELSRMIAQAAIAALEPVTVQEPRPISDVPPDGTWAVLHPGHYGAFTACVLNGGWSMCRLADLRFATHWVPCPFTSRALAERGE